ncbi:Dihydroorotase [hydrothermal vent metagenome]|uniref:dihydroorotase n=1 Tax=hydrothermal vent metagenome TaxID=652676 RepID=A0A3B0XUK4_9ZZZZ
MTQTNTITLIRPDDWHLHVRDGSIMQTVIQHTAAQFKRAIIMPNLNPPVTSVAQAKTYYQSIKSSLDKNDGLDVDFEPLMVLYLTENMSAKTIRDAARSPLIQAIKYYPAGATTNSDSGVSNFEKMYPLFEVMQEVNLPLLVHGEVTDPAVDIFDREKIFIDKHLAPLVDHFPALRIVLEHVTTAEGVQFVDDSTTKIAATVTAHHLLINRNELFVGGIKPHHYCLPILKRAQHQQALINAVTAENNTRFFLGTDSAPHLQYAKESSCGCAGIYTAHAAIELYTEVFDKAEALDKLEQFTSFNGPNFYQLPRNTETISLERKPLAIVDSYAIQDDTLIPFRAGTTLSWHLTGQ